MFEKLFEILFDKVEIKTAKETKRIERAKEISVLAEKYDSMATKEMIKNTFLKVRGLNEREREYYNNRDLIC